MFLSEIRLQNFRNYRTANVKAPPGLVLVVGDNGAGKTNLLEAIYFLAVCRSFRTSRDADLLGDGEALAIRATGRGRDGEQAFELRYHRTRGKTATVNGGRLPRLLDYVGELPAVAFSPGDLALVKGEPAGRRRFLDTWLGQASREYLYSLQRYNEILRRRNALLASDAPAREREPYDYELVAAGADLTARRQHATTALAPAAAAAYRELAPPGEELVVTYAPSVRGDDGNHESIAYAFEEQLARAAGEEGRRRQTVIGPHRDDLSLGVRDRDARRFASEGQQRTAALALRLAQCRLLKEHLGKAPILLMDDVSSELDGRRQARLASAFAGVDQVWLAATAAPDGFQPTAKFTVANGKISGPA